MRRVTYCGAVSAAHLQTLYGGDLRSMVAALSDTGRITNAEMERLARWLDTRVADLFKVHGGKLAVWVRKKD